MFEYREYLPFTDDLNFWFLPATKNYIHIFKIRAGEPVSMIRERFTIDDIVGCDSIKLQSHFNAVEIAEIQELFKKYQQYRPEYKLMVVPTLSKTCGEYKDLLLGCLLCRSFYAWQSSTSDTRWDESKEIDSKFIRCIDWLDSTDFAVAPASAYYHDNTPSGLVIHSMEVAAKILDLQSTDMFHSRVHLWDAVFVSLVHDWCKIGMYEGYKKNVKRDNQWVQEDAFRVKDKPLTCYGHGVSSVMLASRFFPLTVEQELAIRWHMGKWSCTDGESTELRQANTYYPLVLLLQFADALSITKY